MKRAFLWTLLLGLLLAVPAVPQDGDSRDRVIEALEKKLEEQDLRLKTLEAYVEAQKTAGERLAAKVRQADKKGFLYPAPHTEAKKALLTGLGRYANAVATGTAPAEEE